MIKVDLERQWQHGRRLSLASYLERYPELGTFETIPADLILAEYGIHYMTMAYIEGHPLSKYIRPGKPAAERQTAAVVRQVALGLHEAHQRGVVHRDIKPANILINSRGEPVVTDFGLARRAQREDVCLTQAGAVLGTPAYMSPEQVRGRGEAVGPPSDIFSLGVILYELLTSQRPFQGDNVLEVAAQIATGQPIPPRTHRPDLNPRLEAICLKAMAKRPEDRYATMADLAAALTEFLQSSPPGSPHAQSSPHAPREEKRIAREAAIHPAALTPESSPDHVPANDAGADKSLGLTEALSGLSQILAPLEPETPVSKPDARPVPPPLPSARRGLVDRTLRVRDGHTECARYHSFSLLRRLPPRLWIAAGFAAAAVLLGVILLLPSRYGTVKIELSDPKARVEVKVDGDVIDIAGVERPLPLRLRAGKHGLVVTGADFETVTQSFTVKRGTEEPLRITLIPKSGPPAPREEKPVPPREGKPEAPHQSSPPAPREEKPDLPGKEKPAAPVPSPPQPAVYTVQITPADARLVVSGAGATVAGEGPQRTVTVTQPDSKKKITLLATKNGYRDLQRELQPAPGESRVLEFQLQPVPSGPAPATITNSIDMKLVLIPAREFLMGSPDSDNEALNGEKPQHRVQITQPFYLGVYEVTQAEYQKVVGTNPSHFKESGLTAPVEQVSWEDARDFCGKLSARAEEQAAGRRYRLPTEAEWEYACRAGSTTRYGFDESKESLGDYAWYSNNAGSKTHPIGQKKPNAWGLYDMQGNVWEWCADWYDSGYYGQFAGKVAVDPAGPSAATNRVLRGGCWYYFGRLCRPAHRSGNDPGYRNRNYGFRVALVRS